MDKDQKDSHGATDRIGRAIGGPKRLFVGKAAINRTGQMTAIGNALFDAERKRLGKALGFDGELSVGDMIELLAHYVGAKGISADDARTIAGRVNEETRKATAA